MARRRSLTQQLHIGEVDDDELTVVLTSLLPRGAQFTGNEVEYRTADDELALTLEYRDGRVTAAYAGPASSPEIERELEDKIQAELLAPPGSKVCRWTMFSRRPVEGTWRYRDELQIVPAPPQAPRPEVLMADHPFVLDFTVDDSANWQVLQRRYLRKAYELTVVLDLALVPGVTSPSNRGQHHWVYGPLDPSKPSEYKVFWASDGYFIPDFTYLVDALPSDDATPLADVETARYYDPYDFTARTDALTIPTELERLLDCYYGLAGENRERFLRACYWHHTAKAVWGQSQSLHLASLINAVESLASIGREKSDPEGSTKLFKEFMRKYAPGTPGSRKIDAIYDTRSHITHGERLLNYDQPPSAAALTQQSTADRQAGDDATVLCRGALLNWLWAQQDTPGGHLVTRGLRQERREKPGTKSALQIITPGDAS